MRFAISALLFAVISFSVPAKAEITAMGAIKAYMAYEKLKNITLSGDLECIKHMDACKSGNRCNDVQRKLKDIRGGSKTAESSLSHNVRNSSLYKDCVASFTKQSKGTIQEWADAIGVYETAVARVANEEVLQKFLQCAAKNGDQDTATVEKSAAYMTQKGCN